MQVFRLVGPDDWLAPGRRVSESLIQTGMHSDKQMGSSSIIELNHLESYGELGWSSS